MLPKSELFSLVVPILNEEDVIEDTYARLTVVLESLRMPYEAILVDNGSTDASPRLAAELCRRDPRWRYLRLSRNFGYQNSITAGMLAAEGDAIMVIDADLQDPPELIPRFVELWREGNDIVYGVREKRTGESRLRIGLTMAAMRFITWMSDEHKLPLNSGDFRLISRRVRDAFSQLSETSRYVRGMIHWLGFRQVGVPYERRGRERGLSKAGALYLIDFTFNAVFNFSIKPLRMFSLLGAGVIAATILLLIFHLAVFLFTDTPRGFTTVSMLLLMNLGVMSLGIGVLGEYIARIYAEVKRRPLWLVDYSINFPAQPRDGFLGPKHLAPLQTAKIEATNGNDRRAA